VEDACGGIDLGVIAKQIDQAADKLGAAQVVLTRAATSVNNFSTEDVEEYIKAEATFPFREALTDAFEQVVRSENRIAELQDEAITLKRAHKLMLLAVRHTVKTHGALSVAI
jgi:hypothetical protein